MIRKFNQALKWRFANKSGEGGTLASSGPNRSKNPSQHAEATVSAAATAAASASAKGGASSDKNQANAQTDTLHKNQQSTKIAPGSFPIVL